MGLDRTTEAIAHFIGLFDLKIDALRMRELHDVFSMKRAGPELEKIDTVAVEIPANYDLVQRNDDPGTHKAADVIPPILWPPAPALPAYAPEVSFESMAEAPERMDASPAYDASGHSWPINLHARSFDLHLEWRMPEVSPPLPGSMVIVTVQAAYLSDIDLLGSGAFRDPADSFTDLGKLAGAAGALHAPQGFGPGEVMDAAALNTYAMGIAGFAVSQAYGFETSTLRDDAVPAKLLNGVEAGELPRWSDLKPLYHQSGDDGTDTTDEALPGWALPDAYTPNQDGPEGHSLITGGNLLINEARVSFSPVDAPLIAVGGVWKSIDLVSQVSAITNHDSGPGATPAPSGIYQSILIENEANPAFWQAGRDMAGAGPEKLYLSVISGDLVISNYVEQLIEVMDNDMFGMAIGGANTAYILGDNTVFNATNLVTGGMAFDLILVGGDFLTLDTIHQTQILLDDDRIDGAFAAPGGAAIMPGDAPDPSGTGPGADAETGWDPAPDNLLMSEAKLTNIGVDTRAELSETLSALLNDTSAELETLRDLLMNDPALAGLEQARVLKIDGDLIQMNTLKQTILASDRDDIRIDHGVPEDLELVAGTNALLNAAAISARGVDSVVMTRDEGYSDLLIHQARLIDEPDFGEASGTELASEAVAFLMEETQASIAQKMDDTFATTKGDLVADDFDLMSGVLV